MEALTWVQVSGERKSKLLVEPSRAGGILRPGLQSI